MLQCLQRLSPPSSLTLVFTGLFPYLSPLAPHCLRSILPFSMPSQRGKARLGHPEVISNKKVLFSTVSLGKILELYNMMKRAYLLNTSMSMEHSSAEPCIHLHLARHRPLADVLIEKALTSLLLPLPMQRGVSDIRQLPLSSCSAQGPLGHLQLQLFWQLSLILGICSTAG